MNETKLKQTETRQKDGGQVGEIPENWCIKKLAEFCDVLMGQSPPSSTYNLTGDGVSFFQGRKDFGDKYPQKTMWCSAPTRMANDGDVLLSVRAPVGDVNVAVEKCCIGRGLSTLSMKNGNKEFLYYLIQHNRHRLKQIFESEGTVFGCVSKDGLKNFEVLLPEREAEQRAIAKILSDLDEKIEINHQTNKTLEFIAQAIFKRWFVDFKFPGYEKVKLVNGLPDRWHQGTLGEIVTIESGKRPGEKTEIKTQDFTVPLIGASSVMGYVKDALYKEPILIIGRVGTHGIVQRVSFPSFPSDNTLVIQSKYFEFAYQILRMIDYDSLNVGTTQPLITQTAINKYEVMIPSNEIIEQFEICISVLFKKVVANNRESESLIGIRDSLLPRLLSGEMRVNSEDKNVVD